MISLGKSRFCLAELCQKTTKNTIKIIKKMTDTVCNNPSEYLLP